MAQTILVVDDSPTALPELKSLLESDGYHVLTALRAEEALDMLKSKSTKVDLVITEALLSGMDGFELVRHIRRSPTLPELPIIMLTVRSAPEDYAASFEAGADEYFLKPAEAPKILAAVRGLLVRYEMAQSQNGHLVPSNRTAFEGTQRAKERGKIVTVFSLKGGVGTSTIAVNLAVAIKQLEPSARVGLVDLSLEEGIDALLLDIVPTSTVADWSRENLTEATPYLLNQYFTSHRTGVSLMAAPQSPEQAEIVRPEVARATLKLAPEAFDYLVVDTASSFTEVSLTALEMADVIVLPVTPDMAAVKTAVSTMRILEAVKIDKGKIRVVLNEIIPRAGLMPGQIESSLGKEPIVIPHAGHAFIEASIQGMPLVAEESPGASARAIIELARTMCEPEVVEVTAQKSGLFRKVRSQVHSLRS